MVCMTHNSQAMAALERDLRDVFGTRLQSLVAYGMHARDASSGPDEAHDHHAHERPLMHTLAVVDALSAEDLRACSGQVATWHDAGLATPLVLAALEFERSLDAFPLEFGAIIADHVVVTGTNPFSS